MKQMFIVVLTLFVVLASQPLWAMDSQNLEKTVQDLIEQNKLLTKRLQQVENELNTLKGKKTEVAPTKETAKCEEEPAWYDMLKAEADVTGIIMGSQNNNADNGDKAYGSYSFDLNLSTSFAQYGSFFIHLEGGEGEGINDDLTSFSHPNYDAYVTKNSSGEADLTISEAFYEINYLDEKFTLDAGKMDISVLFDENKAAGDETTQFMSNIFVKSMGLTIPEPDNFYCPAIMLKAAPINLVEIRLIGAAVQDDNWTGLFDNGFVAGQINLRPAIMGMQGNYRFYTWRDERRHLDNAYLATASNSYNEPHTDNAQFGWGVSFDQVLYNGITGFFRYSQRQDDLAEWNGTTWEMIPFDRLWTLGLDLSGSFWNRENDNIGMGYGKTLLTNDYQKAHTNTDDEQYVECYYKWTVNRYLALTGDLQWVKNPGGDSTADDVYIFGVRSQLDF